MNLQNEYAKRHGFPACLIAAHEGLVFVKDGCGNYLAIHTGLAPKIHTGCSFCFRTGMVLETITINGNHCRIYQHLHLQPDQDILSCIRQQLGITYYAASAENPTQIENLAWHMFCQASREPWTERIKLYLKPLAQMTYCATHHAAVFSQFVSCLHYLVAGRKYLFNVR